MWPQGRKDTRWEVTSKTDLKRLGRWRWQKAVFRVGRTAQA